MRPQDIVILLKKVTPAGKNLLNNRLAASLRISAAEVSEALERCRLARLVDPSKKKVNILALEEFLIHGLKYVFPVQPQGMVRGIPTATSASPMKDRIVAGKDQYVWAYALGTSRGEEITPLYHTVPEAVSEDETLHKLLALTDTLRFGRMREIDIAKTELHNLLSTYDAR